MPANRPTLLITRPEPQARRFGTSFRQRFGGDWPVVTSPLVGIRYLDHIADHAEFSDVVFTSENAIKAYLTRSTSIGKTAWCVGGRTADAALAAGFKTRTGPGNAEGLAKLIIAETRANKVMYPHGLQTAFDMPNALLSAGIETVSMPVYEQIDIAPTADAMHLVKRQEPILLPLFSARSAHRAAVEFIAAAASFYVATISEDVARSSTALPALHRVTSQRPDSDSMLDALQILISMVNKVEGDPFDH